MEDKGEMLMNTMEIAIFSQYKKVKENISEEMVQC